MAVTLPHHPGGASCFAPRPHRLSEDDAFMSICRQSESASKLSAATLCERRMIMQQPKPASQFTRPIRSGHASKVSTSLTVVFDVWTSSASVSDQSDRTTDTTQRVSPVSLPYHLTKSTAHFSSATADNHLVNSGRTDPSEVREPPQKYRAGPMNCASSSTQAGTSAALFRQERRHQRAETARRSFQPAAMKNLYPSLNCAITASTDSSCFSKPARVSRTSATTFSGAFCTNFSFFSLPECPLIKPRSLSASFF